MRGLFRSMGLAMLCSALAAQGAETAASTAVPIDQEPAHRLVLENAYVRVFDVSLPPGGVTLSHVHRHDGVSVRLSDAKIEDQPTNGPAKVVQVRPGEVSFSAVPAAMTHVVRNVGDTPFHNTYIELLASDAGGADHTGAATDPRVVFENDRVRALRRLLAPGESTPMHTHEASTVGVAVSAGSIEVTTPDGAARAVEVKVGSVQWIEPGTTHRLKNVGDAPVEIIDVELR